MSNNKKIDIQAGPGVYRYFKDLGLHPWICLGEFVDNSVGSFLDKKNQKKLRKIYRKPHLEVSVIRDKKNNTIEIHDNACGIHNSEIDRALKIGERPDNRSGLNEFGVGMKMAAFWFSKKWTITSTAIGESFVKQVTFDIDEIEAKNLSSLESIEIGTASADEHWTKIKLETIYDERWPRGGNTLRKIRDHLSSMYRRFTKNGQLTLNWEDGLDCEILTYKHPEILNMPFVDDMKGPSEEWKVEVDFKQSQYKVSGWIGLLDSPSATKSGFTLLRRGRVIEGQERSWKPDKLDSSNYIFWSGNSEPNARIFGELDFSGFAVSNSKSEIDWGPSEENLKESFLKYLNFLIKRNKEDNSVNRFWHQTYLYIKERSEKLKKDKKGKNIDEGMKDVNAQINTEWKQRTFDINIKKSDEIEFKIKKEISPTGINPIEFPVRLTSGQTWNIKCLAVEGGGLTLFDYKPMPGKDYPRELEITYDINHPFIMEKFSDDSFNLSIKPILEIISIICLAEENAMESNKEMAPSEVRIAINKFLKKVNNTF